MANTTFNPSDKNARITLSGGNLIATCNSAGISTVRAADRQATGKFYFEYTVGATFVSGSNGLGIASAVYGLSQVVGETLDLTAIGSCGLKRSGQVGVDGTTNFSVDGIAGTTTITFATLASGNVVCVAVDAAARRVWFRVGAAGLWNNLAGRDPATGVGGIFLPNLGAGIPVYPAVTVAGLNDVVTANFGDTAFTGAVPSGFTSGFTAGATSPTNVLATQARLEQWVAPNPLGQVTQVALEEWVSTSVVGVQALVTQVALEQWARVPVVVATGRPRRVQNVVRR
jgi:hypothetical protein